MQRAMSMRSPLGVMANLLLDFRGPALPAIGLQLLKNEQVEQHGHNHATDEKQRDHLHNLTNYQLELAPWDWPIY
jgi:hypothetical protein